MPNKTNIKKIIVPECWSQTNNLRWLKSPLNFSENGFEKKEPVLQQLWVSNLNREEWRNIEIFYEKK